MLSKKRLIILVVLAVVSFGVSFAVSSLLGGSSQPAESQAETPLAPGEAPTMADNLAASGLGSLKAREQELTALVKEVRHRIDVYRQKEAALQEEKRRVQIARELLNKQAKELNELRTQIVAPLNSLRQAQADLKQSRIEVRREELANLQMIADSYEKMDATVGAEILTEMYANNQGDDAVKILYLMSERGRGKVIVEITDRKLAAKLFEQMKLITNSGQEG